MDYSGVSLRLTGHTFGVSAYERGSKGLSQHTHPCFCTDSRGAGSVQEVKPPC